MTNTRQIKATGSRGSWFAEVDGELLPCVHEFWKHKTHYHDPFACPGQSPWDEFIEAIRREGRVILTRGNRLPDGGFERTEYIAVFKVTNVTIDGTDLEFDFILRLQNLE